MTKVINLSELTSEPAAVIIDEKGARHEMKPATVQSFMDNVTLVESLGTNASVQEEIEVMIKIITAQFPTLTEASVRAWPLEHLQTISDIARGQNGEVVTADEEKAKEAEESGNDSPAI